MYRQTGSKFAWLLYLRSHFNLTAIYPLEAAGLGGALHIFVASILILTVLPFVLENSVFSYNFKIFLCFVFSHRFFLIIMSHIDY